MSRDSRHYTHCTIMTSPPVAASSGGSSTVTPTVQNFDICVPKNQNRKLSIMRFNTSVDFTKWTQPKIGRENNQVPFKGFNEDDAPKFGAGSEYGREQREEASRKKYDNNSKKYKPEDQPWILQIGGETGEKMRGVRQGGVTENSSYYVLIRAADGAVEAFPVQEWYNFRTVQDYKAPSYEEAEEEFNNRNTTSNPLNVMMRKRMKENSEKEGEEEEGEEKKRSKKMKGSKGDSRFGDDTNEMMDSWDESRDEDDEGGKKSSKGKNKKGVFHKAGLEECNNDLDTFAQSMQNMSIEPNQISRISTNLQNMSIETRHQEESTSSADEYIDGP